MTKYRALTRLSKPGSNEYIEAGETLPPRSEESIKLLLEKGRIEPVGDVKKEEPKEVLTLKKVFGPKLTKAMAVVGILSWLELSFVTDNQLLSVEGITKDSLKEIRKKIPKE